MLKGIHNQNTQSFHDCQHAFLPAASTQMLTPTYACHIQRQTCSHISSLSCIRPNTSSHVHAVKRRRRFFSPPKHSYSHKNSTAVVTNISVSLLQSTPEAESAAMYCLTPRLFAFSLPFSLFVFYPDSGV